MKSTTGLAASCMVALAAAAPATSDGSSYRLSSSPSSPISQPLTPHFMSYSIEPAFWTEFFGEPDSPRELTFNLLNSLHELGASPIIRPGGMSMDSMIFDANQKESVVRTESASGGIYRTTVGPAFYEQWSNFPEGTKFVSTLNFGNDSVEIASGLAAASYKYQKDKIIYYELGNEPSWYGDADKRWNDTTEGYIAEWQEFTAKIDDAVDGDSKGRWWASSVATGESSIHLYPADLIPAGVDSTHEVSQYSIHSYAFDTCTPEKAALSTIANILNHTNNVAYADTELYPSGKAALDSGSQWVIGEFNSIACSGKPNVSDSFAQALWTADVELLYATLNASSVYLHQGATLVFQNNQQLNTPGFSTYDLLYPLDSDQRGEARVLPVFVSQLLVAEALAGEGLRIATLKTPEGIAEQGFAAYGIYSECGLLEKIVILNMKPYYAGQEEPRETLTIDLGKHDGATVKRMTAPSVDEKDTTKVTWAGQSYKNGKAKGCYRVEKVGSNQKVQVKDSEAVLITFN